MPKIKLKTDGLEGESLSFVEQLNRRFAELPEIPEKENIVKEVRTSLNGMLGEDGKLKFDAEKLVEMLGEDENGVRSILKKQGEEINALKERNKKGELESRSLKDVLNDKMDDIKNVFNKREGSIKLNVRAAAVHTVDNSITGEVLLPDDLIESFSLGQFVEKRQVREYIFDVASRRTVAQIEQYKTWLEEGGEEGAFALVAEGALKPLVSMSLVRNHSEYNKVAARYVVTEEFQKFRQNAYAIIGRLINQKLLRDYANILTTNLIAGAAPYTASALDDQYDPALLTDYHAIAAVAAQIEALDFMPDVLVLNPQDKWRIGMQQNTEGSFYLTIPMTDPNGETRMMGFLVRTSNRMPAGQFLLGESGLWEIEDEALSIRMGYGVEVTKDGTGTNVVEVEDDLSHNRFRVIVETYFHDYIASNNEGSFVYANFDTVKAALDSTP